MVIAQKIKDLRETKKISRQHLADSIGVDVRTIGAWETEENEPKATYIAKLAKIFEVSSDYLLGLEDEFGNKLY